MRKGRDAWYAHTCNAIESNVADQHSVLRCADATGYTLCSKSLTMQHVHAAHTCCAYMLRGAHIVVLGPTVGPNCHTCRQHVQPKNGTEWSLQEDLRQRHVSLSLQAR